MSNRRAFTLIELLVVISIVAILMAILSPVIVSARQVFQRFTGSNAMRQMAMMATMYAADHDEVLPPYRSVGWIGGECDPNFQCANPDYRQASLAHGPATAREWFGWNSRDAAFFSQVLYDYGANDRLLSCVGNPRAWVGADRTGESTDLPEYRSYGGQNSYGVNWYLFTNPIGWTATGGGLALSQIDRQSATALLFDASYYLVLPRRPGMLVGNPIQTEAVCGASYGGYWKNLGNSSYFTPTGPPDDATAMTRGKQRWSGTLNVVNLDQSARARKYEDVLNNLEAQSPDSYWDPYKLGQIPCDDR